MKIFVYTLGCRVNQCESEAIARSFANAGNEILKTSAGAELVIVNTCTVTGKAEQKARRVIRIFAKQAVTIVTGCYAQVSPSDVGALSDSVIVLPLTRKAELLELPVYISLHPEKTLYDNVRTFVSSPSITSTVFDYAATGFSYHSRAYLKVQDGCDNNCGFCRVHIARGRSVSLDADTVTVRALELEKNGYHEIVLTGVNLTMYDHEGRGLGGLLEKLLNRLGPDIRIRLSSLEPDHIDDLLLRQLEDTRVQPYFHIPLQSASDKVIKRVNRHYSSSHLEYVIDRLRKIRKDPFLACDVITGLPGEEDEDFQITKSFLEKHQFALLHVFPFSPRPDTVLYRAKDRVPEGVRDERAKILRDLSCSLNLAYRNRQIGNNNEVIIEQHSEGKWSGLTGNYLTVTVDGVPENSYCGDLLRVKITGDGKAVCV